MHATPTGAQKPMNVLCRFPFEDGFKLQEGSMATAEQVIEQLERFISEERMARMRQARACTHPFEPQALESKTVQAGR